VDKRKKRYKAARRFIPLGRNDLLCCAQLICDLLAFYCRILCYFAGRMKKFCIEVTEVLRRSVEVAQPLPPPARPAGSTGVHEPERARGSG